MAEPRAVFRADAGAAIGTGHVMRCLALAQGLAAEGVAIEFVGRLDDAVESLVRARGYAVRRLTGGGAYTLDPVADAEAVRPLLIGGGVLLVADHYGIDHRWEAALRPAVDGLLVIDDLADRDHVCDWLLDQNDYQDRARRYQGRVPSDCERLLGAEYALLRPEFAELRESTPVRDGRVRRILIFFGGGDATHQTGKALQGVLALGGDWDIDVVIGGSNPHRAALEAQVRGQPRVRLLRQVDNMAELMARADLAIGAGGSAAWERCALGLPTLALILADNQRQLVRDAAAAGLLVDLGEAEAVSAAEIGAAVAALARDPERLRALSRAGRERVDGLGVRRVCTRIMDRWGRGSGGGA